MFCATVFTSDVELRGGVVLASPDGCLVSASYISISGGLTDAYRLQGLKARAPVCL